MNFSWPSARSPKGWQFRTMWRALLVTVTAAGGVRPADGQERSLYRGVPVTLLTGTVLTEPNLFSFPTALALVGRRLVVLDQGADSLVKIVDRRTGRLLHRFGAVGSASTLKSAVSILIRRADEFSVLDAVGRQLITYRFVDTSSNSVLVQPSIVSLEMGDVVTSALWAADGSVVASGFFLGRRFLRVAPGGKALPFGPFPLGDRNLPERARQQAYLTTLSTHPDRTKFAAATFYADRIDVFSQQGVKLASARRPSPFEPSFTVQRGPNGPAMVPHRNRHRFAYVALATTASAILALYSGRSFADAEESAFHAAVVHQIGWDGRYQRAFALDRDAYAIAVDQTGSTLYALVLRPFPAIVTYPIPRQLPFVVGRDSSVSGGGGRGSH